MKEITFKNIKDVKAWSKYGKTRLYLKVVGISEYQHKKGEVYLELRNGEWVSRKLDDEDMVRLANELNELKIFDAERVEKVFKGEEVLENKENETMKDLLESLKEAVEDGEAVIIDSGCGEVTDMISSCGVEEIEKFAEEYEEKALELAEKEGWEVVEVNNCKAVKKTKGDEMTKRALIVLNHKPVQDIYKDLEKLGVEQVDLLQDVEPDLAKKFANVPFDKKEMIKISKELALFISGLEEEKEYLVSINKDPKYDIVIIAGEPRLINNILYWFYYGDEYGGVNKSNHTRFYSPYSERISEDVKQPDGSIKKISRFIYKGLAEY